MTREFNKQRRDDSRPSFRNKPSRRDSEERSPRPTRPRLSRETVDRAWESGAQHYHADYRPRSNQEQSPRWRNNQQSEPSSPYQGPGGNRPYGNRRENHWDNPRRNESQGYQGPRSQPFETDRRNTGDQRYRDRRPYSDGQNGSGSPQGFRGNARPRDRDSRNPSPGQGSSQYRDHDNRRSDFNRNTGYSHDDYRGSKSSRGDQHFGRETYHPNRQDRFSAHRHNENRETERFSRRPPHEEHFEGDYERFGNFDTPRRSVNKPFQGGRSRDEAFEERHVTRLPDGRVLKGPRPVQRRNAQFWTDVTENTNNLVTRVHAPSAEATVSPVEEDIAQQSNMESKESQEQGEEMILSEGKKQASPAKPKKRATPRGQRGETTQPRSAGPKPSQRGFKWPTP